MFVDALKGQIQTRSERNSGRSTAFLGLPINYHDPSNNELLRAIWCVLRGAVE